MQIKKNVLAKETLQIIGQFVVEWAEFESYFTLLLTTLLAATGGSTDDVKHEFLRRFRLWNDTLDRFLVLPAHKKKAARVRGAVARSYEHRQWIVHGILDDYERGHMVQLLYPPNRHFDERKRFANRDLLKQHLADFQVTFDRLVAFNDETLWPLLVPLIRKSRGPTA